LEKRFAAGLFTAAASIRRPLRARPAVTTLVDVTDARKLSRSVHQLGVPKIGALLASGENLYSVVAIPRTAFAQAPRNSCRSAFPGTVFG
jgi:hypothetical protein